MFELRTIRHQFCRTPIAFWIALLITLLFALPLYFLKIELTPREVTWLPSLVFILLIIPAQALAEWAVGRARRHSKSRLFLFRWISRCAALPVVATYVFVIYFTQIRILVRHLQPLRATRLPGTCAVSCQVGSRVANNRILNRKRGEHGM